jgi:hypothetical protein
MMGPLDVAATEHRHVEGPPQPEAVEAVKCRRRRARHEGLATTVEEQGSEVGDLRRGGERASVGVRSDAIESPAADTPSQLSRTQPDRADLPGREGAVLFLADFRQLTVLVVHRDD